jgi:hypothetical protein
MPAERLFRLAAIPALLAVALLFVLRLLSDRLTRSA